MLEWRCYFGHSGYVSIVMCSGSHKDLLPEKSDCCLCYPRYLGITRRSCLEAHMVLDMDTESRSDLSMVLEDPSSSSQLALSCQQYQLPSLPAWACIREGSCSMR
jgi:hypothetical protein